MADTDFIAAPPAPGAPRIENDVPIPPSSENGSNSAAVAADQLKSIVDRIERLETEKKAIADDIRDVYAEAKGNGFDTKVLRGVIKLRKEDLTERQEREAIQELYLIALGMLTPRD